MPTPFSSQDLGRIFDARALTRGRTLGLAGGVEVQLNGDTIAGTVQDRAVHLHRLDHPFPARPPRGVRPSLHLPRPRLRASGRGGVRRARPVSRAAPPRTADLPRHADRPARRERTAADRVRTRARRSPARLRRHLAADRRAQRHRHPHHATGDRRRRQGRGRHRATSPTCWAKATNPAPASRAPPSPTCWMRCWRAARRAGTPAASAWSRVRPTCSPPPRPPRCRRVQA